MLITSLLFIPVLSFFVSLFSAKFIGLARTLRISTFLMGLNVLIGVYIFTYIVILNHNYMITGCEWIHVGLLLVTWRFYIDNLTSVMIIVVSTISFIVHLYSLDYMAYDPSRARFMSYLSLFTFFMLMLITGDNFIILFLGWEGVGICSYLLISFWYTRIPANKAAIKAIIVNRIGDFMILLGIIYIFYIFRSLNFATIFALTPYYKDATLCFFGFWNVNAINLVSLFLFLGAMGKSAQIGLHTWLPDAMEGPTPVSALIHAATMVTAGVFLIVKCSPMLEYAPPILIFITLIGSLTSFFSATIGLVQTDIKKIVAYSTCSQLGYMVFACGLSSYHVAFFHLSNHAFFKALLFLVSGAIIHSLANEQDTRKYGGLLQILPFTSIMLIIGSLSLMGFPFLTGFYSKDLILEIAYSKYTISGSFCYFLGLVTAFFTSFYSYRVFYVTFVYPSNGFKRSTLNAHELPFNMAISLVILSIGSIFLGYVSKDLFVGFGTDFWNQSIYIAPHNNQQLESDFIPQIVKLLPLFGCLIAVTLVNYIFFIDFLFTTKINKKIIPSFVTLNLVSIYTFLSNRWYFDLIYNKYINYPLFKICYKWFATEIDKGLLENIGPAFWVRLVNLGMKNAKQLQTGYSFKYSIYKFWYFILFVLIFDNATNFISFSEPVELMEILLITRYMNTSWKRNFSTDMKAANPNNLNLNYWCQLRFINLLIALTGYTLNQVVMLLTNLELKTTPKNLEALLWILKYSSLIHAEQIIEITAIDYPGKLNRFKLVYILRCLLYNNTITVSVTTPAIKSIVNSVSYLFKSSTWLEREVWDMFGINFNGNNDQRRILTDYGFKGHPLRKDFPLTGFKEVYYDDALKRVASRNTVLAQEFRSFTYFSNYSSNRNRSLTSI